MGKGNVSHLRWQLAQRDLPITSAEGGGGKRVCNKFKKANIYILYI